MTLVCRKGQTHKLKLVNSVFPWCDRRPQVVSNHFLHGNIDRQSERRNGLNEEEVCANFSKFPQAPLARSTFLFWMCGCSHAQLSDSVRGVPSEPNAFGTPSVFLLFNVFVCFVRTSRFCGHCFCFCFFRCTCVFSFLRCTRC